MYSLVSSSEVSLPEAISAWSWATVASLCSLGMGLRSSSWASADAGSNSAARRRLRIPGVVIYSSCEPRLGDVDYFRMRLGGSSRWSK